MSSGSSDTVQSISLDHQSPAGFSEAVDKVVDCSGSDCAESLVDEEGTPEDIEGYEGEKQDLEECHVKEGKKRSAPDHSDDSSFNDSDTNSSSDANSSSATASLSSFSQLDQGRKKLKVDLEIKAARYIPRCANIPLENITELVLSDFQQGCIQSLDLTNIKALEDLEDSFFHEVDRQLREVWSLQCVLPPCMVINPNIEEVRSLLAVINVRRQTYTGLRVCEQCKPPTKLFAGRYPTVCFADPVEREGCYICLSTGDESRCSQRMEESNPLFAVSTLEATEVERAAVEKLGKAINFSFDISQKLHPLLITQVNPPAAMIGILKIVEDIMSEISINSLKSIWGKWKRARKEIGAENMTREGDAESRRYNRKLDHGEELVWTMKQNYDAEETEYANITTACLEIERSIGTFINDDSLATLKNTSSRHRADLVEKLINSFIGVLEIRDLRMDVARAREARQKEGRGVRAVKK